MLGTHPHRLIMRHQPPQLLALLPQLAILTLDIPHLLVALPYLLIAPPSNNAELRQLGNRPGNEIDAVGRVECRQGGRLQKRIPVIRF